MSINTSKSSNTLFSLQAFRAIAAWMVVVDHALLELTGNAPENQITQVAWLLGSAGVSIFFVISGFIMIHISWTNFGSMRASVHFLWRRIIRIVPLYWTATILSLGFHRVSATHGAADGWRELTYSLAFVPYQTSDQSWGPILPQGWTLNFEMMFYLLFAFWLAFPRRLALVATIGLLGASALFNSAISDPILAYLTSPIVLWFAVGIILGTLWRHFGWSESGWIAAIARPLQKIGDASYSTYLSHGIVLTITLWIWKAKVGQPGLALIAFSVIAATIAGQLIYIVIEKPLLRALNNPAGKPRRSSRRPIDPIASSPSD